MTKSTTLNQAKAQVADALENVARVIGIEADLIERAINETCDSECPHCNRPLNLPSDEDIENWLKGEK